MSLDSIIAKPWSKEICAGLDPWKQGDLLHTGEQVPWLTLGGDDVVTGISSDAEAAKRVLMTRALSPTGQSVITSQTCDVIGVGQGAKHSTVQVSPVGVLIDGGQLADLTDGKLVSLVRLTSDAVPAGSTWVVDLRINFPVSKALLLAQQPRSGFANEADLMRFAECLAVKAGRSSFHDMLSGSLADALAGFIVSERTSGTWTNEIEQFRIGIVEGTRLTPRAFFLLVVTEEATTAAFQKQIIDCANRWYRANRKMLRSLGISMKEPKVRAVADLSVRAYRDTAFLSVPSLGGRSYF